MKVEKIKKAIDPALVIRIVSEYFEIKPEDIFKKTRLKKIVKIRQILQYFLVKRTLLNYTEVGLVSLEYGRKKRHDHSTILYSENIVETSFQKDRDFLALKIVIDGSPVFDISNYTMPQLVILFNDLINENNYLKQKSINSIEMSLSSREKEIIKLFKQLSEEKQDEAIFKVDVMLRVNNKLNKLA